MKDPINLGIALALSILIPWGVLIHCSPVQPAAKAPVDSGWRTVTVPADFDAGQP